MDSSWFHRQPTLLPGRPIRAGRLYVARSAASGFFLWTAFALYALYLVRDVQLSPTQIIAQGVVLEFTVVVFEIPTGVLADAVSRRLSVIIGTVISGAGWAVFGLFPSFEGILVGQFLWGAGFTCTSGSAEAWVADEIGEDAAARVYLRAAQWRQVATVAGVLAGVGLGLLDPRAPWIAGGAGQVAVGMVFLFTMTEAGWRPMRSGLGSRARSMRQIAAAGLDEARRRPAVRAALGTRFLFGASSEVFASLWGYYLLTVVGVGSGPDEALLFGAIMLAGQAAGLVAIAFGRRFSADGSRASAARALSVLYLGWAGAVLALALAPTAAIAIAAVVAGRAAMAAEPPFFLVWANRGLDPRTRATVLSTLGQADSLGQVAQGPASATVVALGSVRAALAGGALLVLPAARLVRTSGRRDPVEPGEDIRERA